MLIWWRRWEDQRDIPRDEKLGELGTDLGLKKINAFIMILSTKKKLWVAYLDNNYVFGDTLGLHGLELVRS